MTREEIHLWLLTHAGIESEYTRRLIYNTIKGEVEKSHEKYIAGADPVGKHQNPFTDTQMQGELLKMPETLESGMGKQIDWQLIYNQFHKEFPAAPHENVVDGLTPTDIHEFYKEAVEAQLK